ncbi:retrotransposable element [Pimephales promelas]|nr:retrotransposable element [Pimephales promelas]
MDVSFQALEQEMKRVFDRAVAGREAARQLPDLRQNNSSVSNYSIQFRTLAAECKWNKEAQCDLRLADRVQREIYILELPKTLDGLIKLALRVDARLLQGVKRQFHIPMVDGGDFSGFRGTSTVSPSNNPEPMQVGGARLSQEDREHRRLRGLCLYCGEAGHFVSTCPLKGQARRPSSATLLPVRVQWADGFNALVDSGAEGNLIDSSLAKKLHLPITALNHPIHIHALNRQELLGVTRTTGVITLVTSGNHTVRLSLYLTQSPHAPIVLGHPWLVRHGPRLETAFRWLNTAEAVFAKLKGRFVSAPILIARDSSRQFVVEVDASDVGVGAVLSQLSPTDDKMHPCTFFSHRLSPAECNYDIGNRELLAVKLALEEWHHWLEGSGVPFIVWTDHRNLEYIRSAKRLNSRQARQTF